MKLGDLEKELHLIIGDKGLAERFKDWINLAILELAADYDLPTLKTMESQEVQVTEDKWLFKAPSNFHKKIFLCRNSLRAQVTFKAQGRPLDLEHIGHRDPLHDRIGDNVREIGVGYRGADAYFGVYPRANDTLYMGFYEKPEPLANPDDECQCIPPEYHRRVIIPKIVVQAYPMLIDQVEVSDLKPLQWWQGQLREGLIGVPGGSMGLIPYLLKITGGPRRHGGRNPIGPGRSDFGGYY
jgi:hypothetical protein